MTTNMPPGWASALLQATLTIRDRESVAGDLLEEYRESIEAGRARSAADASYVRQIVSIAMRRHLFWGLAFVALFAGRSAFDAFVPTHEFATRSAVTTYGAMAIWLGTGFALAWGTALLRSAVLGGLFSAALAALLNAPLVAMLIAIIVATNNEMAWAGVQSSGGVGEMFLMPVVVLVPATVFATLGGTAAVLLRRVRA